MREGEYTAVSSFNLGRTFDIENGAWIWGAYVKLSCRKRIEFVCAIFSQNKGEHTSQQENDAIVHLVSTVTYELFFLAEFFHVYTSRGLQITSAGETV